MPTLPTTCAFWCARLLAGDTDQQVLDYMVSRYGEFVLLKPRLSLRNALLWGTPVILLRFSDPGAPESRFRTTFVSSCWRAEVLPAPDSLRRNDVRLWS